MRREGQLEPAFVLHRRPYRETSALVEAFIREHGRMGLVARGVRGRRSRWTALLQPFAPVTVSWSGSGELVTLTGLEAGTPLRALTGRRLVSGFYVNELLLRLTRREDPHPTLFDRYADTLAELSSAAEEGPVLRVFERDLLAELGYGLMLERDVAGEPVRPEGVYRYELQHGPVPVDPARASGLVLSGRTLLALARGGLTAAEAHGEARRLMRAALRPYLGERPLKSRELYAQYLRPGRRAGTPEKGGDGDAQENADG